MYKAYITALTNVRPHPNADRLLLADVFGNTVCVSTDYTEGQVGIYFPLTVSCLWNSQRRTIF